MWWTLTQLNNYPTSTTLRVEAITNFADHLFMKWAYHKPRRFPIYRTVRGTTVLCGYKYIWDTPNLAEQQQSGDTLEHTFSLSGLTPGSTIWYYLMAPGGPYSLEIQGPLVNVRLTWPMPPACSITRSAGFPVPHATLTVVPFNVESFDTDDMWAPAPNPSRITVNTAGIYVVTAMARWQPTSGGRRMLEINLNGVPNILRVELGSPASLPAEAVQCMSIVYDFAAGEYIELQAYQSSGGSINIGGAVPGELHMDCVRVS